MAGLKGPPYKREKEFLLISLTPVKPWTAAANQFVAAVHRSAKRAAKSPASGSFQRPPESAFHRHSSHTIAVTIVITQATANISDAAVADTNSAMNART